MGTTEEKKAGKFELSSAHQHYLGVKLGIFKLGCGYDGLDWKIFGSMLEKVFEDSGIDITVCIFTPWKTVETKQMGRCDPEEDIVPSLLNAEDTVLRQNKSTKWVGSVPLAGSSPPLLT
ncbi:hypothetical protein J6590_041250 [Homalodisca vitripennis]|nr:hypothetical protein J6590_041250 [Homalodisca vitripennis]